jgi:hypothetical protein
VGRDKGRAAALAWAVVLLSGPGTEARCAQPDRSPETFGDGPESRVISATMSSRGPKFGPGNDSQLFTVLLGSTGSAQVCALQLIPHRAPVWSGPRQWFEYAVLIEDVEVSLPEPAIGSQPEAEAWVAALSEDPGRRSLCPVARSGGDAPQPGPSTSTAAPDAPAHQVKVSLTPAGPALVPTARHSFGCDMSLGDSACCAVCAGPLS